MNMRRVELIFLLLILFEVGCKSKSREQLLTGMWRNTEENSSVMFNENQTFDAQNR